MLDINSTVELNNGVKMPLLGLGVFRTPSGEDTRRAVREALACGYRMIDTARIYCNEKGVGRGLKDCGLTRSEYFVTTKLWRDDFADPRRGLEESLQRLQLDFVDLYLLHWPFTGWEKAWLTLEKLQQEGLCRAIGVSNFMIHHLQRLPQIGAQIVPQVNQTECHPENSEPDLLAWCREHGIVLEAYSPLGGQSGGLLVNHPVLTAIAQAHQVSAAQVMLRWQLQRQVVVIPKSSRPERIASNAQLYHFALTAEEMQRIDALNQDKRRTCDPDKINERPRSCDPPLIEEE